MLMRELVIIIILVISIQICAGVLAVKSFEMDNGDYHGSIYPEYDKYGEACSLIRIEHNLDGDIHLADHVYKKESVTKNIVYFYIIAKSKSIIIKSAGYQDYKYNFPEILENKKTYILEIVGRGDKGRLDDIPVTIRTIPSGAEVYIDSVKQTERTPLSVYLQAGLFHLKLEREKYYPIEIDLSVKSPKIDREYSLSPACGILDIQTNKGAQVYLNDKLVTQLEGIELEPQKFTLYVEQDKHRSVSVEDSIAIGDNLTKNLYPEPICGEVKVNPGMEQAEVLLIDENGWSYRGTGESIFKELLIGEYILEISCSGYLTYRDKFILNEGEKKELEELVLKRETAYFRLNIPVELQEKLRITAEEIVSKKREAIDLEVIDNQYITGKEGEFEVTIWHDDYRIFQKKIMIGSENVPDLELNYKLYESPKQKSRLYVNRKFKDMGKEVLLVTEHKAEQVRIKIPGYLDMREKVVFPQSEITYPLKIGKDYFRYGMGLGLFPDKYKKFYGLKLPFIYSAKYYRMVGFEANVVLAGNYSDCEGSGTFGGIGIGGVGVTAGKDLNGLTLGVLFTGAERDINGISIGGIFTQSRRNTNGIAIAGLFVNSERNLNGIAIGLGVTSAKCNCNGIAIGGLGVGAEEDFSGISISGIFKKSKNSSGITLSPINISNGKMSGWQIGVVNYAESLKGVQLGILNFVKDGEGGAIPFFPGINIYF